MPGPKKYLLPLYVYVLLILPGYKKKDQLANAQWQNYVPKVAKLRFLFAESYNNLSTQELFLQNQQSKLTFLEFTLKLKGTLNVYVGI